MKDESHRFGLKAYKVLGGSYGCMKAVETLLSSLDEGTSVEIRTWDQLMSAVETLRTKHDRTMEFCTATDGNHGYGVGWFARKMGCQAHVYMPGFSVEARIERTKALGVRVNVLEGRNYDETVDQAKRTSDENGWTFIQDVTLENYKDTPGEILVGYSTMITEIWQQLKEDAGIKDPSGEVTHVFLQVGAGLFASGMINALVAKTKSSETDNNVMPKVVAVEARGAHCFYESILKGEVSSMTGDLVTCMAGMNCGTPSDYGWKSLKDNAAAFLSCKDELAFEGMKLLDKPIGSDVRITSGECGAVTLGTLVEICRSRSDIKESLGIDEHSRVLLISTEGDTDPALYSQVISQG